MDFDKFCKKNQIGTYKMNPDTKNVSLHFSPIELKKLFKLNGVIKAQKGGFVFGKNHDEGGIKIIEPYFGKKEYYVSIEMEGNEYLTDFTKNENILNEFKLINKDYKPKWREEIEIPKKCKIIDTTKLETQCILIEQTPRMIINCYATNKHLEKIISLDSKKGFLSYLLKL
ncbi:hypothetical protein [Aquimarina macrocephali]|uniref:hypothetical protein n=1 Tax=Aquimarina macrocephali TaxID=666563 RepID=UPI003F66DEC8